MAGLDPATQGHTLKQRPWVAGSGAGHDEDVCAVAKPGRAHEYVLGFHHGKYDGISFDTLSG
jgi:hypothetical protein